MMTREYVCCDECFEKIGKRSTKAARLWMTLCGKYCGMQGAFYVMQDFAELRLLETMGFITSTEDGSHIRVKVHGLTSWEAGTPCFCISKVPHDS